ncbi:hypothetical protein ZPAH1_orf00226 [Aeromonas phage ZPAH1]|nr:hypothetical protein ASwh1_177 [Aeromonas phage Aswh_1]QQG33988.1 hypothetical protein ZPAH1_orf00226 [Aeromonas phage ZPAH1]
MNSEITLPKFNYDRLSYDVVYCHFYGRKFTLLDLNTLRAIIDFHKENYPGESEERDKLESWWGTLQKGFAMRGEL